jgi:hypothetical protein
VVDEFGHNLIGVLHALGLEYLTHTGEELGRHLRSLLGDDAKVNESASAVERFNDSVLEVAGQEEPTVGGELLNEPTESGLS